MESTDAAAKLTRAERTILALLKENAGNLVTMEKIETALYHRPGKIVPAASNCIQVHISRLRKHPLGGRIESVRGQGYIYHAFEATQPVATDATKAEAS